MRPAPFRPLGPRRGAVSAVLGPGGHGEGHLSPPPLQRGMGLQVEGRGRARAGPWGLAVQILEAGVHFALF